MRMLILEDYGPTRETMADAARRAGMLAQECATLDEFRAALESGRDHVASLDMNLGLGHRKDGLFAINCVAKLNPGMLVIVHSNSPESRREMMDRCKRAGIEAIEMEALGWDVDAIRAAAEAHHEEAS